jgi:hypothetical protein
MGNITSLTGQYTLTLGNKTINGILPTATSILSVQNNTGDNVTEIVNGSFKIPVESDYFLHEFKEITLTLILNPVVDFGTLTDGQVNYGTGQISIHDLKNKKCSDSLLYFDSEVVQSATQLTFRSKGRNTHSISLENGHIHIAYYVQFLYTNVPNEP